MNYRMVFYTVGRVAIAIAALLLLPLAVSVYFREETFFSFVYTIVFSAVLGLALTFFLKPKRTTIGAREGFAIVALVWIVMSIIGALPFYISREIPDFIDAFFETVSGFTTTGASILTNVEAMSKSLLFWRSFTHWIGGMGVLVFVVALLPNVADRSIHILRAEMPGPTVGKLVPRAKTTARILYVIYIVLTIIEILFLLAGNMPLFDSAITAFGTAGTGGFGIKADSIGGYSNYIQWVVAVFMLIFGMNFNLFYLILLRKIRSVLKNTELISYFAIVIISIGVITSNILSLYDNFADALRESAFHVSSIITTTGFAISDFNAWPNLSKAILLVLMFIGGSAGSTAGGLKVSRVVILFKTLKNELKKMLRPRSVSVPKMDGREIEKETVSGVSSYFALYMLLFVVMFILISFEPFGMETNFSAVAACFNNVGPGFAAVGPTASYAAYTAFSKIILSFSMLLGRLEIIPLVLAFSPRTWRRD
ncbi:MAG: TrkH family potassium uptake protein [Oscillospiraceae bacterium]|nr:TrkH family potassium uptake protein [Oscillospiraceae bacterium]